MATSLTVRRDLGHTSTDPDAMLSTHNQAEQNGRQRLEGYLSCQQRLALAIA